MIASLPMYDRSETAEANARLWSLFRQNHPDRDAFPRSLSRAEDLWGHWLDPRLVLSQTCGMPYRTRLHDQVGLVATPVLDLPDAPPGHYYSVFVVRGADSRRALTDFATAILAYNDPLSQSGWAAPQTHAAALGFQFNKTLETGSHAASARAVVEGQADIAALDALSWKLIERWDPWARHLAIIDMTAPTPALPYITRQGGDTDGLRAALEAAVASLTRGERDTLGLRGVVRLDAERYLSVPTPSPPAQIARI